MATVTAVTTVFPDNGLPQVPIHSKNSDNELKQNRCHTGNARMLSVFYLNLLFLFGPWTYRSLVVGGCSRWPRKSYLTVGRCASTVRVLCAVCVLCRNAPLGAEITTMGMTNEAPFQPSLCSTNRQSTLESGNEMHGEGGISRVLVVLYPLQHTIAWIKTKSLTDVGETLYFVATRQ